MSNEEQQSGGVKVGACPEAEAVLRKQAEIGAAEHELSKVTAAYVVQDRESARLKASLPDMGQLNGAFDELLALHLTGDADDEAVANMQRRIDTAHADIEQVRPALDSTRRMMEALARRAEELRAKVVALKQDKVRLVSAWLLAEAEAEGARYVVAADALGASYNRLRALDLMLRARGAQQSLHAHAESLFVPRWRVATCDAAPGHPHVKEALFDGSMKFDGPARRLELIGQETQRLSEQYGIEFDE